MLGRKKEPRAGTALSVSLFGAAEGLFPGYFAHNPAFARAGAAVPAGHSAHFVYFAMFAWAVTFTAIALHIARSILLAREVRLRP